VLQRRGSGRSSSVGRRRFIVRRRTHGNASCGLTSGVVFGAISVGQRMGFQRVLESDPRWPAWSHGCM
jgi:hypothetical protein